MDNKVIKRKEKIIEFLLSQDDWVTSSQIAKQVNVSDRTIRFEMTNIMNELSRYGNFILSYRGKGYMVERSSRSKLRKIVYIDKIFSNNESASIFFDVLYSIIEAKGSIEIDELADELFISRTTLDNEIKAIKNYFNVYNNELKLIKERNRITILGSEKNKRDIINQMITSNSHSNLSLNIKDYSSYFDEDEMKCCQGELCDLFKTHNLIMTDIGVVAVTIHVMIAVNRIRRGFILDDSNGDEFLSFSSDDNIELDISNCLWDKLENLFNIRANKKEREAIAYLISFRRVFYTEGMTLNELKTPELQYFLKLTIDILKKIHNMFLLDLTQDEDLIVGLTFHLKALFDRAAYRSSYVNPILEDFKNKYPFLFEVAIYARQCLMHHKNINISEDEVGYLAIHFGASIERLKRFDVKRRVKVALLCHTNYSGAQFLVSKLNSVFATRMEIVGLYSVFDVAEIKDSSAQFILSTSVNDLITNLNIPSVIINPLLAKCDINEIDKMLTQIEKRQISIDRMKRFFGEDFFFPGLSAKDSSEVLEILSNRLIDKRKVLPEFKRLMFEREEFSPTVIQNGIAIPHSSLPAAVESTIVVASLDKSVKWYGKNVQLVFMMAIKEDEQRYLQIFYDFIVELSEDQSKVKKLLKINNFDKFWQFMSNYK